jgi:drug/metabolite transporter (DMT)-like permease
MQFMRMMTTHPGAPASLQDRTNALRVVRLIVLVTLLKPVSNLFLAWGMRRMPISMVAHPLHLLQALFDPFVTVGVIMQIAWLLLRMSLLSAADLSFVLPVTAAGYVISTILGRTILHEQVSMSRWAGAILISAGTALVASTPRITSEPAEVAR